jgi:RNA polymerase sigma-70 factor (ECF subfamily)
MNPVIERGRIPERDPLVLEDVYRAHFDFVHRKAARLGGPGIDAEDVAQEVFMVVARRLDTYDGTCEVTTWLYGITFNVVRGMRRRLRIRRLWESEAAEAPPPPLESIDRAEVRQAHRIAYDILDRIGGKKREVFILAELEGLTSTEIAALVGASPDTVMSRLHYARKEFAERLAKRKVRA